MGPVTVPDLLRTGPREASCATIEKMLRMRLVPVINEVRRLTAQRRLVPPPPPQLRRPCIPSSYPSPTSNPTPNPDPHPDPNRRHPARGPDTRRPVPPVLTLPPAPPSYPPLLRPVSPSPPQNDAVQYEPTAGDGSIPIPVGDNDAIAAVLAVELKCDLLLLLSNVNGPRHRGRGPSLR